MMACPLFGAQPLSKPVLGCCQVDPYEQTSVKFESKHKIFIDKNVFENVICEMVAILSRENELNPINQTN